MGSCLHENKNEPFRLFHNQGAQLHFRVLQAFYKKRQGFNSIIVLAPYRVQQTK